LARAGSLNKRNTNGVFPALSSKLSILDLSETSFLLPRSAFSDETSGTIAVDSTD
jgi:hypothetical protein